MKTDLTPKRVLAARILAVAADAIQLGGFPIFSTGFLSPYNDALDVVVSGVLIWLVGFHWAFLPSFLMELVPVVDLVPTGREPSLATRGKGSRAERPRARKNVTRPAVAPKAEWL
jgi:hypothetical protein